MSARGKAGKAAWKARAATYHKELAKQITEDSNARMNEWTARGRVPVRVRIMARLTGRCIRLPRDETRP